MERNFTKLYKDKKFFNCNDKKKKEEVLHSTLENLQTRSPSDMALSFHHSFRSMLGIWKLKS